MKVSLSLCTLLVALPAFAEEGLVLDFDKLLYLSLHEELDEAEDDGQTKEQLAALEKKETERVLQRAEELVVPWAKKEKLAVVFEKGSAVMFHSASLDPTRDLVRLVNQLAPGTFSPRASYIDLGLRIGIVDLPRAMQTTKLGLAAIATLKADYARRQAKLNVEQNKLKELASRAEKLDKKSAEFEANKKEALALMQTLKTMSEFGTYELKAAEKAAVAKVVEKLRPVIASVAERGGFSLVLDANVSDVVYADDDMDLTEQVIRLLDSGSELPKRETREPRPLTRFAIVDPARLAKADPKHEAITGAAQRLGLNLVFAPKSADVLAYSRPDLDLTAAFLSELSPGKKPAPARMIERRFDASAEFTRIEPGNKYTGTGKAGALTATLFRFSGEAGQRVELRMFSRPSKGWSRSGNLVRLDDHKKVDVVETSEEGSTLVTALLSQSGEYEFEFNGGTAAEGDSKELALGFLPNRSAKVLELVADKPVRGELIASDRLDFGSGPADLYRLRVAKNFRKLHIAVTSQAFKPALRVFEKLEVDDVPAGELADWDGTPLDDVFVLVRSSSAKEAPGAYTLEVTDGRAYEFAHTTGLAAGSTVKGQLGSKENARFKVRGEPGKIYVLTAQSDAFDVELLLTNNEIATRIKGFNDDNGGGGTNARLRFRFPDTDEWLVVVLNREKKSGTFAVSFQPEAAPLQK